MPVLELGGVTALSSLAMLPSQADQTILGNVSGGAASPSALTATQVATFMLGQAFNGSHRTPNDDVYIANDVGIQIRSTMPFGWTSSSGTGALDSGMFRLAAASIRQGLAPSATPIAQTFTLGEASRPGTDTNVGGSGGTVRPGLGTGTGTAPKFAIQGVVITGSGSGVQSYQDMIAVTGVTLGFYNHAPVALQTGVAVSAAGIHAALVALGLITA